MKRNDRELWYLSKELSEEYPYTANDIYSTLHNVPGREWKTMSEKEMRELLDKRVVRGY
ncbi:hypothetical protein [Enterococcus sp. AZ007]|uniref:hypothetical protein n=1 Tax=Enterococcus sp. AZ007 TaxID=2774839 RepID=UPI003F1F6D20